MLQYSQPMFRVKHTDFIENEYKEDIKDRRSLSFAEGPIYNRPHSLTQFLLGPVTCKDTLAASSRIAILLVCTCIKQNVNYHHGCLNENLQKFMLQQ